VVTPLVGVVVVEVAVLVGADESVAVGPEPVTPTQT
jgi:hypothetical protein